MKKQIITIQPLGKKIEVNYNTSLIDVLHEFGVEFPCGGAGTCGKCKVKILEGSVQKSSKHQQKLEFLGLSDEWRLACDSNVIADITIEIEQFSNLILADESEFEFTAQKGFGIAVDLGTTTIVAQLIELSIAKVLAVEKRINPQVKFGADLISRIQATLDGHLPEMTKIIRETIGAMIDLMIAAGKVEIRKVVIVGNTVMHHIFCGYDLTGLSAYPFISERLAAEKFKTKDLNWNFDPEEEIIFYPSIGSFVGSDILAGIVATGLHQKEKYTALIDLGTNGEIVVGNNKHIVCASTAAGPAFEGYNISMGMRAVTGAISSINLVDNMLITNVIGNVEPKGICGSALIDAIATLRALNKIDTLGEILSGENSIQIAGNVSIIQKDITEFQFAKAAIAAGLKILAKNLNIKPEDIEQVYIAGGFGSYINLKHVVQVGMIELPEEKIKKMGNTALIGAKIFLFNDFEICNHVLTNCKHINLEEGTDFQDTYINKLYF